MANKNCWEVKNCGRQPGGAKVAALGVCPAATDTRLNGANGVKNGGRACWVLAGTLCGGAVQGSFASKIANCSNCEHFKGVQREEKNVLGTRQLLAKLA